MGDIADMMLDGTLCAGCGELIDEEGGDGVPRYCGGCDASVPMHYTTPKDRRRSANSTASINARKPFKCPACPRRFGTEVGRNHHQRDVHPGAPA